MAFEEPCHFQGVLRVLLLAQRQRLEPLKEEPRVERTQGRADVSKELDAHFEDEGDVSHITEVCEHVPELEAVIAGVGLRELGEFPVAPVEFAPVDDDAAYRRAVAADILRRRSGKNVGSVVQGPHETDADRIVDDERDTGVMGDFCESLEIGHVELRVADGLRINGASLLR